jgi:heme/copper-type cytochrome/quinol oxidase subunit 2
MYPDVDFTRGPRAVTWLRVSLATDVGLLACGLINLSLFNRLAAGEPVGDDQIAAIDAATAITGVASIVALVVTAVLFIRWLLQARRNVLALGARGLVHSRDWAVWGWFIPIIGLFRPYQVVNEIWRASDPAAERPPVAMGGVRRCCRSGGGAGWRAAC